MAHGQATRRMRPWRNATGSSGDQRIVLETKRWQLRFSYTTQLLSFESRRNDTRRDETRRENKRYRSEGGRIVYRALGPELRCFELNSTTLHWTMLGRLRACALFSGEMLPVRLWNHHGARQWRARRILNYSDERSLSKVKPAGSCWWNLYGLTAYILIHSKDETILSLFLWLDRYSRSFFCPLVALGMGLRHGRKVCPNCHR